MRKLVLILGAALALTACGSQVDQCATASNPAECAAWTNAGGDINDYLVGGMVGYMLANRGGQQVIVANPSYHGPTRHLHRQLISQDRQIARLQQKVARQKAQLKSSQAANKRYKSALGSSYRSSRSSWGGSYSGRSSYRSSSFGRRR